MRRFLTDVTDRMTREHPLANLFLGIVLRKLNQPRAAQERFALSQQYLAASTYWQQFFAVLDLLPLYETMFVPVSEPVRAQGNRAPRGVLIR
jgi:hypothetical protein